MLKTKDVIALTVISLLCAITAGEPAKAGGRHSFSAENCSALLAKKSHAGRGFSQGRLHRHCMIAIASTYLIDGLQNKDADAVLLTDDAYRDTVGQNSPASAEAIREGIRNGQEDAVGEVANIQWTIDGDQAWTIWDGIFPGDTKPGFFVSERFTIRDGKISEILIGGVQYAPGLCETDDPCL